MTTDPRLAGFPIFNVNGLTTLGNSASQPFDPTVNTFTWADSVTWVKGRHMVKFGGEAVRCQMFHATPNNARGTFIFLGRWTNDPFADFTLGLLKHQPQVLVGRAYMFATNVGLFVQDDFKLTPNLTLNLGLRYERPLPLVDKYDRMANFVLELDKVVLSDSRGVDDLAGRLASAGLTGRIVLAKDAGLPRSLIYANKTNFAPRFGIAWRPSGNRTVVRGGYGVFYAGSFLNSIKNDLSNTYPFAVTETFQRVTSNPAALTLSDPFPSSLARVSGVTNTSGFEVHPPSQYMQSWNLTVERQFVAQTAVEIAYTGSKGTHLGRRYDVNQPFRIPEMRLPGGSFPRPYSTFSTINYYAFGSNSSYNAGTVTLRRRFGNGIFYRASYTLSKTIDDASNISGASSGGYNGAQDARNLELERGRSDYDSRHVFIMNFTYEVPRSMPRLLRGWQLAGTGRASSGSPFTPQLANATLDQGEATRPDRIGRGDSSNRTPERWFDLSAFVPVPLASYRFGNSGRNILDGPGNIGMNISLSKRFYIHERQSLQFRWEAFNFTNHTNFRQPRTTVDTANAATITSARAARVMQFGLRYQF